jgi:hypothetical protein
MMSVMPGKDIAEHVRAEDRLAHDDAVVLR